MFRELPLDTRRWSIDAAQIFEALAEARRIGNEKFNGSMRFADRNGAEYLLRKVRQSEKSIGRRSPETQAIFDQFQSGRQKNRDLVAGMDARLEKMAPIIRAYGLGRVPAIAARLLRRLDGLNLLGKSLHVVGTHAIFAYEAQAGVHIESALMATEDIDLLVDTRRRLALSGSAEMNFLTILQSVDSTFTLRQEGGFRAVNAGGYHVDLIRSLAKDVFRDRSHGFIGQERQNPSSDLEAVQIQGLSWLENAPRFTAIAMAEDGRPVRVPTIDPRIYATHKAWLSYRPDREPIKRQRDAAQAGAVKELAVRYLGLEFDAAFMEKMPKQLVNAAKRQWGL